jgi:hypothetical protein
LRFESAAREAVSTRLEDPSGKQLADREDAAAATAEAAERAARAAAAAVRNERTAEMARTRKRKARCESRSRNKSEPQRRPGKASSIAGLPYDSQTKYMRVH